MYDEQLLLLYTTADVGVQLIMLEMCGCMKHSHVCHAMFWQCNY